MLESVIPTSWSMIRPGTGTSTTLRIVPSGRTTTYFTWSHSQ